jgi:hypothetical protein
LAFVQKLDPASVFSTLFDKKTILFPIKWPIAKFQFLRLGEQKKIVASRSSTHKESFPDMKTPRNDQQR